MLHSNENKNKLIEWKSKKQELRSTKPEARFPERSIKKKKKYIYIYFRRDSLRLVLTLARLVSFRALRSPAPRLGLCLPFSSSTLGPTMLLRLPWLWGEAVHSVVWEELAGVAWSVRLCERKAAWMWGRTDRRQEGAAASHRPSEVGLRGTHGFWIQTWIFRSLWRYFITALE